MTNEEAKSRINTLLEVGGSDGFDYKDIKALEMAIKALEQTRWIPVSERLPEEDGQYLITVKYKHINDDYDDIFAEHGEWFDGKWDNTIFGHCGEVENIIAWMPLPQPYKTESEDEEC